MGRNRNRIVKNSRISGHPEPDIRYIPTHRMCFIYNSPFIFNEILCKTRLVKQKQQAVVTQDVDVCMYVCILISVINILHHHHQLPLLPALRGVVAVTAARPLHHRIHLSSSHTAVFHTKWNKRVTAGRLSWRQGSHATTNHGSMLSIMAACCQSWQHAVNHGSMLSIMAACCQSRQPCNHQSWQHAVNHGSMLSPVRNNVILQRFDAVGWVAQRTSSL